MRIKSRLARIKTQVTPKKITDSVDQTGSSRVNTTRQLVAAGNRLHVMFGRADRDFAFKLKRVPQVEVKIKGQ